MQIALGERFLHGKGDDSGGMTPTKDDNEALRKFCSGLWFASWPGTPLETNPFYERRIPMEWRFTDDRPIWQQLTDQLNSALTGHAWGQVYGTVS